MLQIDLLKDYSVYQHQGTLLLLRGRKPRRGCCQGNHSLSLFLRSIVFMVCAPTEVTMFLMADIPRNRLGASLRYKRWDGQCDRVSLYRHIAVLSKALGKFQESESIQIITGLGSSLTAAIVFSFPKNWTIIANGLLIALSFP